MVTAIIQARVGSTRLPGKVLAPIAGQSMLAHVVERVRRARSVAQVVVATSTSAADQAIVALCGRLQLACVCGSEQDVLDRYWQAAKAMAATSVVRITADCPLIDPRLIDEVVALFWASGADYCANINPPSYPDGLDVELFSMAALQRAWQTARLRSEREHVTLYMRNHPELFRSSNLAAERDRSALRWTVDEPRDLEFVRAVFAQLGDRPFLMDDVLDLLHRQPELATLNDSIVRNAGLLASLRQDGVFE